MRLRPFSLLLFAGLTFAANAPRWAFTFASSNLNPAFVTVDAGGNTYLAGSTVGSPFTATPGAYQSLNAGGTCYGGGGIGPPAMIACRNVFVIKLDPSGAVVFATYLGGSANVDAAGIAVDPQGNVYVGGPVDTSLPADPSAFRSRLAWLSPSPASRASPGTLRIWQS